MLEVTLRQYLAEELSVPVYLEVPKTIPAEYVLLQLIDSGKINQIDAATFSIVAISDSLYNAALLSNSIKEALLDSISLRCISHVDLGGEMSGIDSANKKYQYELTFNFYYYKEET